MNKQERNKNEEIKRQITEGKLPIDSVTQR
jgi:hypothetical protein